MSIRVAAPDSGSFLPGLDGPRVLNNNRLLTQNLERFFPLLPVIAFLSFVPPIIIIIIIKRSSGINPIPPMVKDRD